VSTTLAPFPTIQAVLPLNAPRAIVTQEYLLRADDPVLELRTRFARAQPDRGTSALVGDIMFWGADQRLFMPGHGSWDLPEGGQGDVVALAPLRPGVSTPAYAFGATQTTSVVNAAAIKAVLHDEEAVGEQGLDVVRYLAVGGLPAPGGSGRDASDIAAAMSAVRRRLGHPTRTLLATVQGAEPALEGSVEVQVLDGRGQPISRCRPGTDGGVACEVDPAAAAVVTVWLGNGLGEEGGPGQRTSEPVPIPREGEVVDLEAPRPAVLALDVTDSGGADVACKVSAWRTVDGERERRNFALTRCAGEVLLPPGDYDVFVTHGPEWTRLEESLTLAAGDRAAVAGALRHVVDTAGWIAADFHVHAEQSTDSTVSNERRLRGAVAEGLDYYVATDHDFVSDLRPWLEAEALDDRLVVASGVEVSTAKLGHFNVWPLADDRARAGHGAPRWHDLEPEELFELFGAGEPGRVVQCNHPRFAGAGYFDIIGFDPVTTPDDRLLCDTIEVINGIDHDQSPEVLEDWMALLNQRRRITATATSDCHGITDFIGNPRTLVALDGGVDPGVGEPRDRPGRFTAVEADAALVAGRAVATAGPMLTVSATDDEARAAGVGEILATPSGAVTVRVRLQAPDWMPLGTLDLIADGEVLRSVDASAPDAEGGLRSVTLDVPLPLDGADRWVVAWHHGGLSAPPGTHRPPWALTNPVFVDGDGDGTW
jgi:hypothetical protein